MASIKKISGKGGDSYKITVSMGRDAQDRQIRHYKTWKPDRPMTAKQAEKAVQRVAMEFEREIQFGFQADDRQTFAEYSAYVYSLMEQRGKKPQTLASVQFLLARINEHIGHMKLTAIRPQHLNALYKKLSEPGANRWRIWAAPAVDFKELMGSQSMSSFARICGVRYQRIKQLLNGGCVSRQTAATIEQNLGRKDLFRIIGDDKPLSPKTILKCHGVIRAVLGEAEKEMIIPYNPAKRATPPPNKALRTSDCLQPEQLQALIAAARQEPIELRTLLMLFITTGCRRGEIFGLKWPNVDFASGQIKIETSLNYLPGKGVYEGGTKTGDIRYIALPKETLHLLRKYRAWQTERRLQMGDQWINSGYVFTAANGAVQNPTSFNIKLRDFCKRHDLPLIHPHTFRHTAASIMLSNGIDVLTVSKVLGHSVPTTTLNIYGHIIEDAKRKAAECISDAILRNKLG